MAVLLVRVVKNGIERGSHAMVDQGAIDQRLIIRAKEAEMARMAHTHTCAECGGPLVTPWDGEKIILRCGRDPLHQGQRRGKSLMRHYKEGAVMPIELANMAERKLRRNIQ